MKKKYIPLIIAALMFVLTACGQQKAPAATANPATAESQRTIEAFGLVVGADIRNITIDFPAKISKVNVREGDKVKFGDPVITLDINEFKAQIDEKKLELNTEKHNLNILKGYNASSDMSKFNNDLVSLQSIYDKSLQELAAKKALLSSGAISQHEYDEYQKVVDTNKKNIDDVTFSIGSFKSGKQAEIDQKSLLVAQLEASLTEMQNKLKQSYLNDTTVVADVQNGLVYDIGYQQGDTATPAKKAYSIINLDSLLVNANVPEEFVKDVKLGAEVNIVPLADKSKTYKGKVMRISNRAIQNNGETDIPIEISIVNGDDFLRPNFNVDVEISK